MPYDDLLLRFARSSKNSLKEMTPRSSTSSLSVNSLTNSDTVSIASSSSSVSTAGKSIKSRVSFIPQFLNTPSLVKTGIKIQLITYNAFQDLCKTLRMTKKDGRRVPQFYADADLNGKAIVRLAPKANTTDAFNCNIGVVMNDSKGDVAHVMPEEGNIYDRSVIASTDADKASIEHVFKEDVEKLQQGGKRVFGVITGGRKTGERDAKTSREIYELLVKTFRKTGIEDISTFWGSSFGFLPTDVVMDASKRTVYLRSAENDCYSAILTAEKLIEKFEIAHLAEGDLLETSTRTYTAAEFNALVDRIKNKRSA